MKQLIQNLSVDGVKQTQFTGGNVCVSSCGTYLLCINGTSVDVIDIRTGLTRCKLDSEDEQVTCIALSPDDKHLVTAHRNLLLKQWTDWRDSLTARDNDEDRDTRTTTTIRTTSKCTRTWKAIHSAPVAHMCFDASSSFLATASCDFTTKVWDIGGQYCTHNLRGAQGIVSYCRFYPDLRVKQQCIAASEDGNLRVYDLNTSRMEACLSGHFSAVTCFEYMKSDSVSDQDTTYNRVVSSSRDKCLIVWDLATFAKVRIVAVYESIESLLLVSQAFADVDDRLVMTMGNEGLIKIWDVTTGRSVYKQDASASLKVTARTGRGKKKQQQQKEAEAASGEKADALDMFITHSWFNAETRTLVLVTVDRLILFVRLDASGMSSSSSSSSDALPTFDERLAVVYKQLIGDNGEILDAQLCNSEQNLLALATNSEHVKIYDLNTWDCQLLKGHTDLVICLSAFVPQQHSSTSNVSYVASSSKDATIRVWRITTGTANTYECVATCHGHTQDVGALCFSTLGFNFLVSASMDTTLKLWSISVERDDTDAVADDKGADKVRLNVKFTSKAHEKDINSVCVSPNDKLIASASSDKTAKIWDTTDGTCMAVLRGHKRGIWCIQFSSVDQVVATSSADATIKLWSLGDFSCFKTFEGHSTSVLKVAFVNNSSQLISTASDGLVKLWSISNNECVNTFDEHDDKTWALCCSRDQKRYVTGGADGKLIVWRDVSGETLLKQAEDNEQTLLQEQELSNFVKEKKWRKALALAIHLDKPFKCYQILREILEPPMLATTTTTTSDASNLKARAELASIFTKLNESQIVNIMRYSIEWNTNSRYCHVAQCVFEIVLRHFPPETFLDHNHGELATKLVEQFMPYSERHYARLNKLSQSVMFIDYLWHNMKLST